jgi:hypothetical protein
MASHQEYVAEAAAKAVMSHINDCFDRRCFPTRTVIEDEIKDAIYEYMTKYKLIWKEKGR